MNVLRDVAGMPPTGILHGPDLLPVLMKTARVSFGVLFNRPVSHEFLPGAPERGNSAILTVLTSICMCAGV
jgi:hypothetical protein